MKTNSVPTYSAEQYIIPETGEPVEGMFTVTEWREGNPSFSFKIQSSGDLFQQLLKRGLPENEARNCFYQIQP